MKHIRLTRGHVIGMAVAFGVIIGAAVPAKAATLKQEFINSDGDRTCVYEKHFKEVYINVGFNGHCSFNVPDEDLN